MAKPALPVCCQLGGGEVQVLAGVQLQGHVPQLVQITRPAGDPSTALMPPQVNATACMCGSAVRRARATSSCHPKL